MRSREGQAIAMTRARFGAETTAEQVLEGVDLSGKKVLVTGGSSGLGAETCRVLAARGALVILAARNRSKAAAVARSIRGQFPDARVDVAQLELGNLDRVRRFADRIRASHDQLHILINNAGVMACPYGKTEDGFELHFAINHLGHFLMTRQLEPVLVPGARVVMVSSSGHQISPVRFDDIHFDQRPYDKWQAYGQSKTANVLFAVALNQRLRRRGIEAFSLHPGAITTGLLRHLSREEITGLARLSEAQGTPHKSVLSGAATQVYAATAPELRGRGGAYLSDCQICEIDDERNSPAVVRSYALDRRTAERLWQRSIEMISE